MCAKQPGAIATCLQWGCPVHYITLQCTLTLHTAHARYITLHTRCNSCIRWVSALSVAKTRNSKVQCKSKCKSASAIQDANEDSNVNFCKIQRQINIYINTETNTNTKQMHICDTKCKRRFKSNLMQSQPLLKMHPAE